MGDIVNLRRARKAQARKASETVAAVKRAKFGETKAGRTVRDAEKTRADHALSQKSLDRDPE